MSKKLTTVLGGMFLVIGLLAGTVQGCGDGDDRVALCNQGCDKAGMCIAEATPAVVAQCKSACNMPSQGGGQRCTNEAAIISAVKACLAMSCETYANCIETVPPCQGGGGGTSGGAGSTGQGGSGGGGGSANCAVCTRASACCTALQTGQDCSAISADTCNSAGANQATLIQGCQAILTGAASLPDPPSACLNAN